MNKYSTDNEKDIILSIDAVSNKSYVHSSKNGKVDGIVGLTEVTHEEATLINEPEKNFMIFVILLKLIINKYYLILQLFHWIFSDSRIYYIC